MKISFNWLNRYIDLSDYKSKLPELSNLLTKAGLEVEDLINPAENWEGVVVGKLLDVGKHPDADKLTLCKVDVGASEPLQIVCGAKNHKTGDHVAVATVGTVLPGDFKIKKSKIRGVESFGMLCSESELGLSEESDGIMTFAGDYKLGQAFADAYDEADIIFELNVTPNRADCLSHIGLARELSTLLDRPTQFPETSIEEKGKSVDEWIRVEVKDTEACPRFCGRMISGVKVGPSPDWLQKALTAIGVNSVNNVVDITNFVLFEYGQPLHAYDFDNLEKASIRVEKAQENEVFTSLDGTEIKMSSDDLMIKDGNKSVGIAGVVGGKNTGVSQSTQDIFLEAAFFVAEGVRRTSRAHGIETDACYRFSRGVDPEQTLNAMNRAAALIQEVAGGEIQKGHIDIYPAPVVRDDIFVTTDYIGERLGYEVSQSSFENWMARLNCQVAKKDQGFSVSPPSYRWDLSIKEDLVEEFARLNGYDQIEEKLPLLDSEPSTHTFSFQFANKVSSVLTGLGLDQTLNYAFIGKNQNQKIWGQPNKQWGLMRGPSPIALINPISEELAVMRESLLPSLFKNLVHNYNHGNSFGRFFEIAPSHHKVGDQFKEENRLAFLFWGQNEGLWQKTQQNQVVFELKSTVEALLRRIGGRNWRWDSIKMDQCPDGFHPSQTVTLFYEGKNIGVLGTMHPSLKDDNKIRTEVAWAEFNFEALMMRQPRDPKFKPLPKFPSVERDIAFLADETLSADKMGSEIKKAAGPLLNYFEVFDIYQDKELKAAGRKSIAFRLRFQSDKETLKDEEINGIRDKVVNSLCQKLGLEIR